MTQTRNRKTTPNQTVYYWSADHALLGRVRLAATAAGLCKLALGRESDAAFHAWLARIIHPVTLIEGRTPLIETALAQIHAYLSGDLRTFETPLDLHGTSFQRQVWAAVARIPYGATATYGHIAAQIGRPSAVRAVGAANGANPLPLFVPCHRVLGADGGLPRKAGRRGDLRGYGGGLEIKAALLDLERSHAR